MAEESRHQGFGTQIKKSPYFAATERHGCRGYSVYNHFYTPRDFGDPIRNYWNLVERVILIDAAPQRQVEITGPDAWAFTRLLTPRNLENCAIGQCKYVIITSPEGGVINDPVLLRLAQNHVWLSAADSDLLLWAKGVAVNSGLDVEVREPDVAPLQIQGPRSPDVMRDLFGSSIDDLRWYWFQETDLDGMPMVISRTGWTSERGYEVYLKDTRFADQLWQRIIEAGQSYGMAAGHTSTARRIEGGTLALVADMDLSTTPLELGFDRLIDLDQDVTFIGKDALRAQRAKGLTRKLVGFVMDGSALAAPNDEYWPCQIEGQPIGFVTTCVHSPRLDQNIGFAMVTADAVEIGTRFTVRGSELTGPAEVVAFPFFDPKKAIPTASRVRTKHAANKPV